MNSASKALKTAINKLIEFFKNWCNFHKEKLISAILKIKRTGKRENLQEEFRDFKKYAKREIGQLSIYIYADKIKHWFNK